MTAVEVDDHAEPRTLAGVVPVQQISDRAREIKPGPTVLAIVGGLLFGLGWLSMAVLRGVWFVLSWCAAAYLEGWDRRANRPPRPSRRDLESEVARLQIELARFTDRTAGGPGLG